MDCGGYEGGTGCIFAEGQTSRDVFVVRAVHTLLPTLKDEGRHDRAMYRQHRGKGDPWLSERRIRREKSSMVVAPSCALVSHWSPASRRHNLPIRMGGNGSGSKRGMGLK